MRRTVTQFLLFRFAGMFLMVLFALTSLLVLFDLLARADDLAVHHEETFAPMAYYAALRLPVLLTMITPMSVLLAALVTFERLATQYELVALQSAGVSLYQVCLILLLGGLGVSGLHLAVAAWAAAPAELRLFRWAERNYEGLPTRAVLEPGPAWFAAGNYHVHIANARELGQLLEGVVIIEHGLPGVISTYYEAQDARFDGRTWRLRNGSIQKPEGGPRRPFQELAMDLPLKPDEVATVRLPVASLGFTELEKLGETPPVSSPWPAQRYQTWRGRRLAEPLGSLVMILLAAPLGLQLKRSGRQLRWGGQALALGFLFFIVERILLALGEGGTLPPPVAVWAPLVVFALGGIATITSLQK